MAEGKTLAPAAPCSLCDEDDSVKFCVHCNYDLCGRCAKAHGKIGLTSHHKLVNIQNKGTSTTSPTVQAHCTYHTTKQLSVICEQCLCALCESCAETNHKDHKLLRTNLNPDLLHRICVQKVPEFLQLLQQLEKEKDGSPTKVKLYRTARDMVKTWRGNLWKIIDDDAGELLKQIDEEIKKQEALLSDISSNLKEAAKNTDQQMSALSNARNITDPRTLLLNIHEGDEIIKKGKSLLEEIECTRATHTIDDLLPFRNELTSLEKSLHTFFTMTPLTDVTGTHTKAGKCTTQGKTGTTRGTTGTTRGTTGTTRGTTGVSHRRDYNSMTRHYSHHVGDGGGRISESCDRDSNTIIMYKHGDYTIYVFDTESKQKKQYSCTHVIDTMTTLCADRHVIIDWDDNVHLLDGNFHIVSTLSRENGDFTPFGVIAVTDDTFILSQVADGKTRFSEVTVSTANTLNKRKLSDVNVVHWRWFLSLHSDSKHVTFASGPCTLHTVDVTTGLLSTLELGENISDDLSCLFVDGAGKILVGDGGGRIYYVTPTKYECEFTHLQSNGYVTGITVRGDKFVKVTGKHIKVYK